jgi:hypothetical protein
MVSKGERLYETALCGVRGRCAGGTNTERVAGDKGSQSKVAVRFVGSIEPLTRKRLAQEQ